MLHTETVSRQLPHLIRRYRNRNGSENHGLSKLKQYQLRYATRKAAGLCTSTGCSTNAAVGHTRCQRHLREISERNKKQYTKRMCKGLCTYCGTRPGFWGVRCMICRQKFAKHPLPNGARRALRRYRQAEEQHRVEQSQVGAKLAIHKLLANGEIKGKRAKALRLYAGVDHGKWRTYSEVGKVMHLSRQAVCQLLAPSKATLARILEDNVPWRPVRENW